MVCIFIIAAGTLLLTQETLLSKDEPLYLLILFY